MSSTTIAFLFYSILLTGVIFFVRLSIKYNRVRRIVLETDKKKSVFQDFVKKFKGVIKVWIYYFTNGDNKKLLTHTLIAVVAFFGGWVANSQSFKLPFTVYVIGFLVLLIFGVWSIGKKRNYAAFAENFPQILQTMLAASSAGAGLLQAIERCGIDMKGKLADEFKNLYKRLALGEDAFTVFEDSYRRFPYKEYYFFIIIIKTNLKRGGQIREIIGRLSRLIADSNKMEQKKKTMTSEARMSAIIVAAIPVLFFIFMKFAMPDNFDFIVNNPDGRLVLYYVIGSESIGIGIIWMLMRKAT